MRVFLLLAGLLAVSFNHKTYGATAFGTADSISFIRLELSKSATVRDETLLLFQNQSHVGYNVDEDTRYFQGINQVSLYSFISKDTPLVVNSQPFPTTSRATRLSVNARTDGRYQLKLTEIVNMPRTFNIWLIDKLTNDSLDLRANRAYTFNISKADTNTYGGNRFLVVIRKEMARSYHLLSFKIDRANSKEAKIGWTTENEETTTQFTVERSNDKGKTFKIIDSLLANNSGSYSLTDHSPQSGVNFYRLKQKDFAGIVSYSETIQWEQNQIADVNVNVNKSNATTIYPNPASNMLNIAMSNTLPAGSYKISISNTWGLKVKEGTTSAAKWQGEVSDLKPGLYLVTITNTNDNKVVGYNKFMKQ